MHTDSGMTGISLSGYMPYMTVASLEMSDEPFFQNIKFCKAQNWVNFRNILYLSHILRWGISPVLAAKPYFRGNT